MIHKITICGIPHTIEYVSDVFQSDTMHFGMLSPEECKIYINRGMPEAMQEETLMHEILHAIFLHTGKMEYYDDEELIQSLANALHTCLQVRGLK